MAKRTESAPFSFATFCNHLTKINPESSVLKNNPFSKINAWIPLGNYLLNAQVTGSLFRGIPEGRVTMIAGQSGCLPGSETIDCYIMKTLKRDRKINTES